jgi:DNA-binding CsgD family transcriptional regulator
VETADWAAAQAGLAPLQQSPAAPARTRASAALVALRLQGLRGAVAGGAAVGAADGAAGEAAWQAAVAGVEAGETEFQLADACGHAAEAAWLRGDAAAAAAWAGRGLTLAASPWLAGRLRRWLRLAGAGPGPTPPGLPAPLAAEEAGDAAAAWAAWRALGCPWEAAVSVLSAAAGAAAGGQAPDPALLQAAWDEAVRLGADPLADRLRQALQAQGRRVGAAPRGPYRAAAAHPLGFTAREQQVAALLAAGLGNAQIAARLHRSERTVEHHVSAILAKLGVRSRTQAVARLLAAGEVAEPPAAAKTG